MSQPFSENDIVTGPPSFMDGKDARARWDACVTAFAEAKARFDFDNDKPYLSGVSHLLGPYSWGAGMSGLERHNEVVTALKTPYERVYFGLKTSADASRPAEPPEPQRRLARLRALGGDMVRRQYKWRCKGISQLVEAEKNDGHTRTDRKTIKLDLIAAAESERQETREGSRKSAWPP
jgi:hypothetical protein